MFKGIRVSVGFAYNFNPYETGYRKIRTQSLLNRVPETVHFKTDETKKLTGKKSAFLAKRIKEYMRCPSLEPGKSYQIEYTQLKEVEEKLKEEKEELGQYVYDLIRSGKINCRCKGVEDFEKDYCDKCRLYRKAIDGMFYNESLKYDIKQMEDYHSRMLEIEMKYKPFKLKADYIANIDLVLEFLDETVNDFFFKNMKMLDIIIIECL